MARVTLTIWDTDDGGYRASADFDPPREQGAEPTQAQRFALRMMHAGMMAAATAPPMTEEE